GRRLHERAAGRGGRGEAAKARGAGAHAHQLRGALGRFPAAARREVASDHARLRTTRGTIVKPARRRFLHLAVGAAALPALSRITRAQSYPSRLVTIIVPFAAGGTTDVIARILGEHMSRTLGQQFIVENVVGAGGTTGSTRAMRANPDGYTIELGNMGTHAASVALYPSLAYNPEVDFAPIGMVAGL